MACYCIELGTYQLCLSSRSFVENFIARHGILFCRMNFIVGRNALSCCQRYSTNLDSVIAFRFNIENIDRIANTASDDVCNRETPKAPVKSHGQD